MPNEELNKKIKINKRTQFSPCKALSISVVVISTFHIQLDRVLVFLLNLYAKPSQF